MNTNGIVMLRGDVAAPSFAVKLLCVRKKNSMQLCCRRTSGSCAEAYHMSPRERTLQPNSDSTLGDKNLIAVASAAEAYNVEGNRRQQMLQGKYVDLGFLRKGNEG